MAYREGLRSGVRKQLGFAFKDISEHLPGAFIIYRADKDDDELLYANQEDAVRAFQSQLAVEANEGCIYRWKDREDFQFERNPLSYECWLDGDYCGNHYEIFLEEKPVILGSASKRSRKNL